MSRELRIIVTYEFEEEKKKMVNVDLYTVNIVTQLRFSYTELYLRIRDDYEVKGRGERTYLSKT